MPGQRRHRQPSAGYQIRVRGHLGPTTLRAFAAPRVQTQAPDTPPPGVAGQSALLGVPAQIEELGLELRQTRRDI
jgi:hypothetical protein